jgi:hypothetical protein
MRPLILLCCRSQRHAPPVEYLGKARIPFTTQHPAAVHPGAAGWYRRHRPFHLIASGQRIVVDHGDIESRVSSCMRLGGEVLIGSARPQWV